MKIVTAKRGFFNKTSLLTFASVMAFSGLATVLPFILSPQVAAASVATEHPFTASELSTSWSPDRQTPSGGYASTSFGGRNDVLELNIDTTQANAVNFYRTEGLGRQITDSSSIKADIYIDSSWYSQDVRAGIWGVGRDASDAISAYPILEFVNGNVPNNSGYSGLRAYNTETGAWTNLATAYNPNAWNTFEITLNQTTDVYEYRVNGSLVGTAPGNASVKIGAAILNSYNNANNDSSYNYAAHWSKFTTTSPVALTVPVNLQPGNNSSTNDHSFSMSWDVVPGATIYQYRTSNSLADATTLGPIAYADDSTWGNYNLSSPTTVVRGNSYTPPNDWYWQVRAGDELGNWSDWSVISKVTTDYTAPNPPGAPAATSAVNAAATTWVWDAAADASGSGLKGYEYYVDNGGIPADWTFTTELGATTTAPGDGTYTIHVRSIDNAGNPSGEVTGSITLDITDPDVEISSSSTVATTTPTISGTIDDETATLLLSVDGGTPFAVPFSGNTWAYEFTTPLTFGLHTLEILAQDAVGNFDIASADLRIALPTVAPTTATPPAPVEDAGTTVQPTTPLIISPAFAAVLGGTTDTAAPVNTDDESVEGAATGRTLAQSVNTDANKGIFMGLGWYWWLLIIAGITLLIWLIAGAVRKQQPQN
ncbi:MAG: hypothetical protein WAQ27_05530 [Candidatus Microsaccharimonas sp.]